mmetsp:Transcript_46387/g.129326  ORF Transcript_46387/g.129326 Transcript_46387/m.129326 type:complete len:162 (-) Transcript_46387:157-642(-)
MKTSAFGLLALAASASAFAPAVIKTAAPSNTQLNAESRREALAAIGLALGGLVMPGVGNAMNPALETFKGGKKTKGQFIPGKGMRMREEELLAMNPALETFKGRRGTKGQFIPGKGMRNREENLLAMNPALETFKGGKKTKGEFIPGKGLRLSESFESLMG